MTVHVATIPRSDDCARAPFAEPQSVSSQVGVRSKRPQDVVGTSHQQLAQHRVPGLADAQLRLAVSRVLLLGH